MTDQPTPQTKCVGWLHRDCPPGHHQPTPQTEALTAEELELLPRLRREALRAESDVTVLLLDIIDRLDRRLRAAQARTEALDAQWNEGYRAGYSAGHTDATAQARTEAQPCDWDCECNCHSAQARTEALDVDTLENAMRDHILDDRPGQGWPHWRPGATPGDGPEPIDGCSDLCASDIAARYAAILAAKADR